MNGQSVHTAPGCWCVSTIPSSTSSTSPEARALTPCSLRTGRARPATPASRCSLARTGSTATPRQRPRRCVLFPRHPLSSPRRPSQAREVSAEGGRASPDPHADVSHPFLPSSLPTSQGCGFRTAENGTAGIGANYGGAGVYALDWSSSGISMWFFPRNEVPGDILSKNPSPSSWKKPTLHIAESSCSPISHYFSPRQWVINTDLCGTWASGTWNSDNSYAGQSEGSCAARTGYATCAEYVENEAKDFKHGASTFLSLPRRLVRGATSPARRCRRQKSALVRIGSETDSRSLPLTYSLLAHRFARHLQQVERRAPLARPSSSFGRRTALLSRSSCSPPPGSPSLASSSRPLIPLRLLITSSLSTTPRRVLLVAFLSLCTSNSPTRSSRPGFPFPSRPRARVDRREESSRGAGRALDGEQAKPEALVRLVARAAATGPSRPRLQPGPTSRRLPLSLALALSSAARTRSPRPRACLSLRASSLLCPSTRARSTGPTRSSSSGCASAS